MLCSQIVNPGYKLDSYINKLSSTDALQDWGEIIPDITGEDRRNIFNAAVPMWLERMVQERKLLLHPSVIDDLYSQKWVPNELQKKMIWASVVCKLDSEEQKPEKARIRKLIQQRYSNEWWEDVYERAGRVWPAWHRLKKQILSIDGTAIQVFVENSIVMKQIMHDKFITILNMVPKS